MNLNSRAFSGIDSFCRSFFNANGERLELARSRNFGAKKRSEPKPSVLRLENLEDRALLSVAPPFAVSPAAPNSAAVFSEYSAAESTPAVPDLASVLNDSAPLQTQAARNAGDLAVVNACGLDPDDTSYATWNTDGRLTYLNCKNSNIAELNLTGCTALREVNFVQCANLTDVDLSGLQSLQYILVRECSKLTELDFSSVPSADQISVCYNANLTSVDLSGLKLLGRVAVYENANLTDLNLDNTKTSGVVTVYNNGSLAELGVSGLNASTFSCYGNALLSSFSASNCQASDEFILLNNPLLKQVDLSNNPFQTTFQITGNSVETLSVAGCSALEYLYCGEDALETLYAAGANAFALLVPESDAWDTLTVYDESGNEIETTFIAGFFFFIPGSYDSNPITMEFYEEGASAPTQTATIWTGEPVQGPTLEFNQYSKTVTAITDKNVVLTRGVVATGIDNPTYTVYIDGVKSTKITVNKTWGQIVYSGGNNGMPARSEPYVVTVTASAGGKSASAEFLLTIVNDSKLSTTVSTNSPKYNTAVRATVKPTGVAVTYQWYRTKNATPATAVWTAIDGATKATYVPTSADLGYYLKVMVRGTGANDGRVTQAITSGKVTRPIISVTLPTTVEYNKTLTAFPSPSSATATYQWYRGSNEEGWTAIKNATGLKYVPQLADVGKFLKVTVTGKDNFTGTISKVTGKRVTASLISVTVAGNQKVGSKITSYLAPSSATVTYQWYSSKNGSTWTAISGATEKTYTPTDADAGKYLKVTVKGTGYFKGTVSRTLSGKIAAASTSASAQDAFADYEDAVLDCDLDEFWNTLEETLNN